jgi:hypothetical protein
VRSDSRKNSSGNDATPAVNAARSGERSYSIATNTLAARYAPARFACTPLPSKSPAFCLRSDSHALPTGAIRAPGSFARFAYWRLYSACLASKVSSAHVWTTIVFAPPLADHSVEQLRVARSIAAWVRAIFFARTKL